MMRLKHGTVTLCNSNNKSSHLSRMLLLLLATFSLNSSFTTALKDPLTRYNNGTIIANKGIDKVVTTVDPNKYFGDDNTRKEPFVQWLSATGNSYANSMFHSSIFTKSRVDFEDGAAVFWTIVGQRIKLAVAVRAQGWLGFGISESGSMLGSDMMVYNAREDTLSDMHVINKYAMPLRDTYNRYELNSALTTKDFIIVEVERDLDTGDGQDLAFFDDSDITRPPNRFIAAWGDGDFGYHGEGRVSGPVRFWGKSPGPNVFAFREHMERDVKAQSIDLRYGAVWNFHGQVGEIPGAFDSSRVRCFESPDLFDNGPLPVDKSIHIVGIERIHDNTAEEYIRRVILYSAKSIQGLVCRNTGISIDGGIYDTLLTPTTRDVVRGDVIYAWSPGADSVAFPSQAGILFGHKRPQGLVMEVHYHNPSLNPRIIDQSGFTLYYTTELRDNNIGIMRTGTWTGGESHRFNNIQNFKPIPILENLQEHVFTCHSNCTKARLPKEGVTVVREQIGMNTSPKAIRVTNSIVSEDGTTKREGSVAIYRSKQNGFYSPRNVPYQILPGDSIETKCYYNGSNYVLDPNEPRVIGNSGGSELFMGSIGSTETRTFDEQCTSIIYYYPAQDDDIGLVCDVSTGRGLSMGPNSEDEKQELDGCVATDTSKELTGINDESELVPLGEARTSDSAYIFRRSQLAFIVATSVVGLFMASVF